MDTGEVVREPGHVGEMRARAPCNMIGYVDNPEATAECYDEEGWFKSGDLVYFDSDGYFYYVDRLKEMIKYKSHQVRRDKLGEFPSGIDDLTAAAATRTHVTGKACGCRWRPPRWRPCW